MSTATYKLTQAVDVALRNFPTLRGARARLDRSGSGVALAKTAYLPQLNMLVQELRTTQNVIAGAIFPQTLDVLPVQSGPIRHSSRLNSVWGNNEGVNFSWELYDFGLRSSNVKLARAEQTSALANLRLTELDVATGAAQAYLSTVAAKEMIRAQRATVTRMEAWQLVVHTLVERGLRPGVDSARADADVANARIGLIEAERATELAQVDLAETLGMAGVVIDVDDSPWIKRPQQHFTQRPLEVVSGHPLAVLHAADVKTARAQVHVWDKTWNPHLWFHSAMWGRGSGDKVDNRTVAGGILPQSANFTVGFSISFPVFDVFVVKAQRLMALRTEQYERANYDLAIQMLTQKDARAHVLLDKARKIASETTILIEAARENEVKALERYRVGLSNVVEVAEAEEILARAQVQDAVAEARVWEAILAVAYAQGDLKPFLTMASSAEGNR